MATWTQVCIPIPTAKGIEQWIAHVHDFTLTYPGFCATLLLMWSYYPEIPFMFMYNVFYAIPRAIFHGILDILGFRIEGIGRNEDTQAPNYQSNSHGGYVLPNSFFSTYRSYGAVAANDLEINWMASEGTTGNRGIFMTTLSYVLFICAGVVLYKGFIVRMP